MTWIYIFFSIIVLSALQFLLFYSVKKKSVINTYLQLNKRSNSAPLLFATGTVIFYVILLIFLRETTLPQPNSLLVRDAKIAYYYANKSPRMHGNLQQLEHDEFPEIETYYYLYTATDTSQKTLQNLALYLRKSLCKKPCTISFYDNIHAYILDHARATITTTDAMQIWNEENYVFVANHYLGYLGSGQSSFTYFPFQDIYYLKLIGK